MAGIAIRVEGIGKKYKIGKKKSGDLRESFSFLINKLKRNSNPQNSKISKSHREDFWALKEVSFTVKQGEAVGIIG
ncbi:MAG: ABC transporter ATP-binding protein, partial [Cyclobacteriaceae bacterium]|nr:ABC transporter ATP-binding protein [Cyclobacteriaceae bacterium]